MKVSLIGDSIRAIGYGRVVPELLGDGFEVWQPSDNARFAKYTLRGLFDWKAAMEGTGIVHWNNGLWDICDLFGDGPFTSEQEYINTMLRIADILLSRYDKVIFATTTPVSTKNVYSKNETIKRYNDIIVPLLQEKGIIINDLFSLVNSDIDKYISEDAIHLSEAGIKLCSEQVTRVIKDVAKTVTCEKALVKDGKNDNIGAPI